MNIPLIRSIQSGVYPSIYLIIFLATILFHFNHFYYRFPCSNSNIYRFTSCDVVNLCEVQWLSFTIPIFLRTLPQFLIPWGLGLSMAEWCNLEFCSRALNNDLFWNSYSHKVNINLNASLLLWRIKVYLVLKIGELKKLLYFGPKITKSILKYKKMNVQKTTSGIVFSSVISIFLLKFTYVLRVQDSFTSSV